MTESKEIPNPPNHYEAFGRTREEFEQMSPDDRRTLLNEFIKNKKNISKEEKAELRRRSRILLNEDRRKEYDEGEGFLPKGEDEAGQEDEAEKAEQKRLEQEAATARVAEPDEQAQLDALRKEAQ